jgi:hypothetical protein
VQSIETGKNSEQMDRDSTARRLMVRLDAPPFTMLADFCGSDEGPGCEDAREWQIWTTRETTLDQTHIEDALDSMVGRTSSIFHVGVGNSGLARRFAYRASMVRGITLYEEEKEYADTLGILNYTVSITNKYSRDMAKINGKFDFVVDNNPGSYSCCLFHFCRMMVGYSEMLRNGGVLLTAESGLGWVSAFVDPAWCLRWTDWNRLGHALSMPARQITPTVFSLVRSELPNRARTRGCRKEGMRE